MVVGEERAGESGGEERDRGAEINDMKFLSFTENSKT